MKENLKYIKGATSILQKRPVTSFSSSSAQPTNKPKKVKQESLPLMLPCSTSDCVDDDEWDKIEQTANKVSRDGESNDDENSSDDDDNSDYDDSDDDIKLEGNVEHVAEDYTFEFNDMRDDYTSGIRTLLRYVLSNPSEAYDLADLITAQTIVGTVINCEGGDDAFAFATVLPLQKCVTMPTLRKLITQLTGSLNKTDKACLRPLRDVLASCSSGTDDSTGLLLHQRFSNLPIPLIGPLHRNLEEDLSWAKQRANIDGDAYEGDLSEPSSSSRADSNSKGNTGKRNGTSSSSSSSSSSNSNNEKPHFFAAVAWVLLLCPVSGAFLQDYDFSGDRVYDVLGNSGLAFDSFEDEVYFQQAAAAAIFKPAKACNAAYEQAVVAALVPLEKIKSCVNGICALLPDDDTA